jgi:hypothetical protein
MVSEDVASVSAEKWSAADIGTDTSFAVVSAGNDAAGQEATSPTTPVNPLRFFPFDSARALSISLPLLSPKM